MPPTSAVGRPDRRRFLRLTALAGAAALTGCAASDTRDGTPPIRLGYVSPQSGPLFAFGEADAFVVADVQRALVGGLKVGGRTHPVEILVRDSQSSPERAGDLARELITRDQVTMLLAAPTPETTNPVADAGERYGTPCVTTGTPYQSWYLRRDPAPDPADPKPYRFTWHFSWGLEDIIAVFADMWSQVANNGVLGGLWPDDGDGRAWGRTFPKVLGAQGYRVLDMGRYQAGQDSFAAELDKLEAGGAGIVTGVPPPADFATFWKQAADRGYRPPVVSIGRAMFPAFIEAMGTAAGVSTRGLVEPGAPVPVLADRGQRPSAGRGLPGPDRPPVDPAYRARARPVRGGDGGPAGGRRHRRPAGPGRGRQGDQHGHHRRPGRLGPGPGRLPQRLEDAAGRWPVAARHDLAVRAPGRLQRRPPRDPGHRRAAADPVTA